MASAAPLPFDAAALSAARRDALRYHHGAGGPSYHLYPEVEAFHDAFGGDDLCQALERSNAGGRGLSLYVHVPFCRQSCGYRPCPHIITRDTSRAEPYLSRLDREMVLTARHLDRTRPVEQLYWGGGTPTFLTLGQMSDLFDRLDARFGLSSSPARDYAIDIDPREADVFTLRHLQVLGFNRLILEVLDFNPEVQQALGREQPRIMTETLMEEAHRLGFRSLTLAIGYGLPRQTPESFADTLADVIELNPARISLQDHAQNHAQNPAQDHAQSYGYRLRRGPLQQRRENDRLPAAADRLAMLQLAADRLCQAGYVHIGMDHFARPDDSLAVAARQERLGRGLQGYTTHGHCDLLGLGVSAVSRIDDVYAQNAARLSDYADALDSGRLATARGLHLGRDARIRRAAIERLMCDARLDLAALGRHFNIDAPRYFAAALARLGDGRHAGLIERRGDMLSATADGRLVLHRLARAFDAPR
ncbi:oxygen-independent coproporphyrinogen III oxidase [Halomonas piscis]|uniref:Coproporphyrinogen-III oxidase n=1 Tax=Halomonas piscis TaxID=3031727 RepID=A0ABY9YXN8_9GAMM|nr:oxygen-independent coproporphyrinogen III oxidase [Halomonas piscis]WNK19644.1 oxygen-independent coproporphyrinogen III oxidase [Halomonas piscis]